MKIEPWGSAYKVTWKSHPSLKAKTMVISNLAGVKKCLDHVYGQGKKGRASMHQFFGDAACPICNHHKGH